MPDDENPESRSPRTEPPPAVRAQLLATEHWSLLASRSTTQSEVLTRISIFLTLVSAGLVSLALAGQATGFESGFPGFALTVLGIILLVGILTQVRVTNVSMEDLSYVLAMNRLRAAYVRLDPGVAPYLMTSPFDDRLGTQTTYYFLGERPRSLSQILGSSMVFIFTVNATLLGLLLAGLTLAAGWATGFVLTLSVLGGVIFLAGSLAVGAGKYYGFWRRYTPQFPSPPLDAPDDERSA